MSTDDWSSFVRRHHLAVRLLLAGGDVPPDAIARETASVFRQYRRTSAERPSHVSPEKWLRGIVRRRLKRRAEKLPPDQRALALALASESASRLEREDPDRLQERLSGGLKALSQRKTKVIEARYAADGCLTSAAEHLDGDEKATVNVLLRLRSSLRDLCTGKASLSGSKAIRSDTAEAS